MTSSDDASCQRLLLFAAYIVIWIKRQCTAAAAVQKKNGVFMA